MKYVTKVAILFTTGQPTRMSRFDYLFGCHKYYLENYEKLLNHRFPEAHYNVFHDCILSSQQRAKVFLRFLKTYWSLNFYNKTKQKKTDISFM